MKKDYEIRIKVVSDDRLRSVLPRPPGYFDDCYDKALAKESIQLASRLASKPVK